MKYGSIIILVLIMSAVLYFARESGEKQHKLDREKFEQLKLALVGVVEFVDATGNYNSFGIVRVRIISSNVLFYDERNAANAYYCVIKNQKAELYQFLANHIQVGDTVEVNTSTKTFTINKSDSPIDLDLRLNDSKRFMTHVRKLSWFRK